VSGFPVAHGPFACSEISALKLSEIGRSTTTINTTRTDNEDGGGRNNARINECAVHHFDHFVLPFFQL
jgi:hypothetical protein